MENQIKEVSVFFPAYNEEDNIEKTVINANDVLKKIAGEYEILVINDGSNDKTAEVVEKMILSNNKIRLISHDVNKGYGSAVRSGFKYSKYEWVVLMDSDGQFDFSEFPNFIKTQKETNADLVIGYYKKRKVSFMRKLNSWIWQLIIRILFGLKVKDIDCGFKLIRKNVIDTMNLESNRGAFISTEFLVKAKEKEKKIVEIPITHYPREAGEATGSDIKVILNSFKDLYRIKRTFFVFCFVGATSALLSIIIFNILLFFGLSFIVSLLIGILSSIVYNFLMNRNLTFTAKETPVKKQIGKYGVVYAVSKGLNLGVSFLVSLFLGPGLIQSNIAVIVGIAVSIPFSFFGSLLWAFKKKGKEFGLFKILNENRKI